MIRSNAESLKGSERHRRGQNQEELATDRRITEKVHIKDYLLGCLKASGRILMAVKGIRGSIRLTHRELDIFERYLSHV